MLVRDWFPRISKKSIRQWQVPLALLAVMLGLLFLTDKGSKPQFPTCSSQAAQRMVKLAFDNHITNKVFGIQLEGLKNIKRGTSRPDRLVCFATAVTERGEADIRYRFYWSDDSRHSYAVMVDDGSIARNLNYGTFSESLRNRFGQSREQ